MKNLILFLILVLLVVKGFPQSGKWDNWLGSSVTILDKWMNLKFTPPVDYIQGYETDRFVPKSRLARIFQSDVPNCCLTSPDKHFLMFIEIYRPYIADDSISFSKLFPKLDFRLNVQHINQMKFVLKQMIGEKVSGSWKEYITYYPSYEAKSKFNADTVTTCRFELKKAEYYKNKYSFFQPLYLQKMGRGAFLTYLFYDKTGAKNLNRYMKAIESSLWYGDKEPVPNLDEEETVIIDFPKQPKRK
jgi:hypothetical protein